MGQLIIVENDKVEGVDQHIVNGASSDGLAYSGVGDYDYRGKITDQLSDFVRVNSQPVALKSSSSSLNPGEDIPMTGKHAPDGAQRYVPVPPSPPVPNKKTLQFTAPVGTGNPSSTSGSAFVKVDGVAILLDGDKIDTCGGEQGSGNSTVSAENQDFVFCSE